MQTAFELFGDRVKHWTTIHDPASVCYEGYGTGNAAPGLLKFNTLLIAESCLRKVHAYLLTATRQALLR